MCCPQENHPGVPHPGQPAGHAGTLPLQPLPCASAGLRDAPSPRARPPGSPRAPRRQRQSWAAQVAVLVNDMAEVSIDAALLAGRGAGQPGGLVALSNGCICCTLRDDLLQARPGLGTT